jgi:hypothetical protein
MLPLDQQSFCLKGRDQKFRNGVSDGDDLHINCCDGKNPRDDNKRSFVSKCNVWFLVLCDVRVASDEDKGLY